MVNYIFRRIMLMLPTFFGTTFLVFIILSYLPGGPFQRAVMQLKYASMTGEGKTEAFKMPVSEELSPDVLKDLKKQFGLDKPLFIRYLIWLGLYKKEVKEKKTEVNSFFREDLRYVQEGDTLYAIQKWIKVLKENDRVYVYESGVGSDFKFCEEYEELPDSEDIIDWKPSVEWQVKDQKGNEIRLVKKIASGIFTFDLGKSYVYDEPVIDLIVSRLHISCYFGFLGFALSYLICIPLGIYKALNHGSKLDFISSLLIFIGYSVPGYVLGALLLVYFGGGSFWNFFPLGGFVSDHFTDLSLFGKIKDLLHHTFLPVISYTIGSFATLTVLMKNSILENLSQDYVRTAFAKGLSEKKVIFVHVLKNSLIPVSTGIGQIIGIFLAGSYFIEKVFNIDGIGMLSYKSIISADYPVILGFLVLNTIILLAGNLISDICYATIDPRIRFK